MKSNIGESLGIDMQGVVHRTLANYPVSISNGVERRTKRERMINVTRSSLLSLLAEVEDNPGQSYSGWVITRMQFVRQSWKCEKYSIDIDQEEV